MPDPPFGYDSNCDIYASLPLILEEAGLRFRCAESIGTDIMRHISVAILLLASSVTMATHVEAQECSGESVSSSRECEFAARARGSPHGV